MMKDIFSGENELFKKLHPILFSVFSRGVLEQKSNKLIFASLAAIFSSPLGWIVVVFKKGIHLTILFGTYWFLRDEILNLEELGKLLITIALIGIFYKELHQQLVQIVIYFLIIVTGGGFLRWICKGYLSGAGFRRYWLTYNPMEGVVGIMVSAIPNSFREQYDKLMNLYLDSNSPEIKKQLVEEIADFKSDEG